MRLFFLLLSLVSTCALTAQDAGIQFSHDKLADLLATAKAEDKLVFIDAYTTWCGPCKMMTAKIFPQEKVGKVFNERFVNAKIDMEKGEGLEIAKRYEVMAYPTYLFLNGDGELVHKAMGYIPADALIAVANDATGPNSLGALNARYNSGDRDADFVQNYLLLLSDLGQSKRAGLVMDDYLKLHTDWSDTMTLELLVNNPGPVGGDRMHYLLTNPDRAVGIVGSDAYMMALHRVLLSQYMADNQSRALPPTEEIIPFYTKFAAPLKDRLTAHYTMFQADQMRDADTYLKATKAYLSAYPSNDFSELNTAAWNFFERSKDPEDLRLALAWAQQSVDLYTSYPNLDTLAWLYDALDMDKEARETARRAIKMAKETGQDYSDTERILE